MLSTSSFPRMRSRRLEQSRRRQTQHRETDIRQALRTSTLQIPPHFSNCTNIPVLALHFNCTDNFESSVHSPDSANCLSVFDCVSRHILTAYPKHHACPSYQQGRWYYVATGSSCSPSTYTTRLCRHNFHPTLLPDFLIISG